MNEQLIYCPLAWMFSSKGCYKRINKIHEKSLRFILNDYESSFDSLLSTLNEKAIHQRCINVLLTEVYKYLNGYFPDLMNQVFYLRQNHYNLRNFNVFATNNPRNKYLLNSFVYRANQLWQTLPSEIKDCASLQLYKDKIETWRVIDVNVIFAQDILLMLVIFNLFSVTQSRHKAKQICTVVNCKLPKCPFSVKAMYSPPWIWSNFISYAKVFVFFYSYLFVLDVK